MERCKSRLPQDDISEIEFESSSVSGFKSEFEASEFRNLSLGFHAFQTQM